MFVQIDSLTKTYGTQNAIDNLSFIVNKGEILGFLGPNGAGKTTTMKIITCFIPPTSGTVQIGEHNIHEHPLEIRKKVGYLPEHNPLYLDMYVKEFLRFAGEIQGMQKNILDKRIAEVIALTGLEREQHKKIGMLSKGYRQRVGLSQAMIHNPEVLILDEPTTGLDPNQIIEIRNLIKEIGKNTTVIFSSHILPEVEAISNRVVIINKGVIVADAPAHQLKKMANNANHIRFSIDKKGFNTQYLKNQPGVLEVIHESDTKFIINTDTDIEIRKTLFEECIKQGFVLMRLEVESFTLEDVFRKLTLS